ncbi:hypothetical protein CL657_01765 [bacterium]|nr:hypothetical protein [bacterium]|tara:strand:- start:615 stop:1034 length:420 start_codon:yes stop_codon:yes gene_type:complete
MNWFWIASIGAFGIAIHQFSLAKLARFGIPINLINVIIYVGVAILLGVYYYAFKQGEIPQFKEKEILWLAIGTISIFVAIIAILESLEKAANPGYVGVILSTSGIILTILSLIYLNSSIDLVKGLGITFVLIGAICLSL